MKRAIPLAVLLLAVACGKKADLAPEAGATKEKAVVLPPVKVETAKVNHQKMPRYLTLTGSVAADKTSEVAANVSGRITATYVERGQPVKAGQVIAVVDSKAASFSAAAAMAQSQSAETQVALAKQDCERAELLFKNGAIPKSEYDRQKSQCSAQLYNANAARAQADLQGKLAGDAVIRAPIDGIIGERYVNVGEYVQPPTKVASIFQVNPARITISVPEVAVGRVSEGQTLEVQVSAYPDRNFPAVVRYLSPALRSNTRDLIIEAAAKNEDGALKPGMFATVLLLTGEEDQPTVPAEAIRSDGTVRRMYLARNGSAFELVVRTGVTKEGRIAVLEALSPEELVIVKPPPGLRDGTTIAVQ